MKLKEFVKKYEYPDGIIIKRKKEILDITVDARPFDSANLRIYADGEILSIGDKTIKISDLERIYIFINQKHGTIYTCKVKIIGKNGVNFKNIIVESFSEEDLDKIDQLFQYFLYPEDVNNSGMYSDNYEFLLENNPEPYYSALNTYTEEQKNASILNKNDTSYRHIKVLPRKYYTKYLSKNYLLFETKFGNLNYMDVWVSEKYERESKRLAYICMFSMFAVPLLCGLVNLICGILMSKND